MDTDKIKRFLDLLHVSGLDEFEYREGNQSVRFSRHSARPVDNAAPDGAPVAASASAPEKETQAGSVFRSPMVGVFHRRASPDQPPFVEPGQAVRRGDTLGIIEAMKTMNHIEADSDGTVVEVLVGDGDAVAFDQPLLRIA